MTRATDSLVAVVLGLLLALGLYGCGSGDDDDPDSPNVLGLYKGTTTQTNSGCLNPADNKTFTANSTVNISSQSGADFSGTVQVEEGGEIASIAGQITADGKSTGTLTFAESGVALEGTFSGTFTGNTLTVDFSGRFTAGETCVFQGRFTGTRQ